jgi:hypothetical protein
VQRTRPMGQIPSYKDMFIPLNLAAARPIA